MDYSDPTDFYRAMEYKLHSLGHNNKEHRERAFWDVYYTMTGSIEDNDTSAYDKYAEWRESTDDWLWTDDESDDEDENSIVAD